MNRRTKRDMIAFAGNPEKSAVPSHSCAGVSVYEQEHIEHLFCLAKADVFGNAPPNLAIELVSGGPVWAQAWDRAFRSACIEALVHIADGSTERRFKEFSIESHLFRVTLALSSSQCYPGVVRKVERAISDIRSWLEGETLPDLKGNRALREELANLRELLAKRLDGANTYTPQASSKPAGNFGEIIQQGITDPQRAVHSLQRYLEEEAGREFDSFRLRHDFAKNLKTTLDMLHVRLRCPSCKRPAVLRARKGSGYKSGYFIIEHYSKRDKKQHFCGGTVRLPKLRLVIRPGPHPLGLPSSS